MTDNPKSKIQNPQSFDPALRDHLDELTELAREIGAAAVTIIRQPAKAQLYLDWQKRIVDGNQVKILDFASPRRPAGLLVVLRFPASDGGETGVEVK